MIITPKHDYENNRDYALRIVRENIINMEIKPGSLIGEQEIATMLNLSRTPVHEAFLELSKSKIIEIFPQKGCFVSYIDPELINESRFLRKCIECAVVQEACDVATGADIEELEETINLQEFYNDKNNDKFLELDNEFHKIFYRICNKMQCYYMVSLMALHFDRVRSLSLLAVKDHKILEDHKAILDAVKNKDKDKATAAFMKHMSRFDLEWDIIADKYGEYIKTE